MENEKGNLVKLKDIDDDFIIDMPYATKHNFTGEKIYNSDECWLDKHTAEILIKAKNKFREDGYRVKVMDAYRPLSAQRKFWEIMPDENFVAVPPDMTKITEFLPKHMNGLCVDVSLTDMDGNELKMPCEYDTMGPEASLTYEGHDEEARANGIYLKNVMESVGFEGYDMEWWHFYDVTTEPTRYLDFQI